MCLAVGPEGWLPKNSKCTCLYIFQALSECFMHVIWKGLCNVLQTLIRSCTWKSTPIGPGQRRCTWRSMPRVLDLESLWTPSLLSESECSSATCFPPVSGAPSHHKVTAFPLQSFHYLHVYCLWSTPISTFITLTSPQTSLPNSRAGNKVSVTALWYKEEFGRTCASCTLPGQPTLMSIKCYLWSTTPCSVTEYHPFLIGMVFLGS